MGWKAPLWPLPLLPFKAACLPVAYQRAGTEDPFSWHLVFQSLVDGPGVSGVACPSFQAAIKLASSSLGVRGPEVPGNSEHGQSVECIQRPKAEWHGSIGEALNIWCLLGPISSLLCPLPGREVSTHPGAQVAAPEPSQMLTTTVSHGASSCMSPGWASSWESPEGLGKQLTHPNAPPPFCRTATPPTLPSTVSLFSLPDKPLLSSS